MNVLYQDGNMVICIKPSGVLSQSDEKGRANMPSLLKATCKSEIYTVHRLDLEVSGVMVYAKNAEAAAKLSQLTCSCENFKKEYLAVVEGEPPQNGVLEDLLYHDANKNKTYVVKRKRRGVKTAKLSYEVLKTAITENGEKMSLVKIRLYTGRTHQIRVQFASRNFPISGDRRYGASNGRDICLFSHKIEFVSPFDGKTLSWEKDPPKCGNWTNFE